MKFCPECGHPLQATPRVAICSACKLEYREGEKFCQECGSPLQIKTEVVEHTEESRQPETEESAPLHTEGEAKTAAPEKIKAPHQPGARTVYNVLLMVIVSLSGMCGLALMIQTVIPRFDLGYLLFGRSVFFLACAILTFILWIRRQAGLLECAVYLMLFFAAFFFTFGNELRFNFFAGIL